MGVSTRAAVLSDVHGNSPALEAVLDDVRRERCVEVYVLGDVVNGVDPAGSLEMLGGRTGVTCIKGNAELYLVTPDLDEFPVERRPAYVEIIRIVKGWLRRLSDAHLEAVRRMPEHLEVSDALMVHDSPLDGFFPRRRWVEGLDARHQELYWHGGRRADGARTPGGRDTGLEDLSERRRG